MAQRPIGKIDHIGIAVKSIAEARKFFEGALGATFLYEHANPEGGYTIVEPVNSTTATSSVAYVMAVKAKAA